MPDTNINNSDAITNEVPYIPRKEETVGDKFKDAGSWTKDYFTALKHGRCVTHALRKYQYLQCNRGLA